MIDLLNGLTTGQWFVVALAVTFILFILTIWLIRNDLGDEGAPSVVLVLPWISTAVLFLLMWGIAWGIDGIIWLWNN